MGYKIAITGGIGSGKSTVCDILKEHGYEVFSCDEIYKKISQSKAYIEKIGVYYYVLFIERKRIKKIPLKKIFLYFVFFII